jgi:septation ring formation regulator EzrA
MVSLPGCLQRERRIYYYLWQLYHLQQDEAQALSQQADLAQQLEELNAAAEQFEGQLNEQRKTHSGLVKERMRIEKEQKKLQKKQAAKVRGVWAGCCEQHM